MNSHPTHNEQEQVKLQLTDILNSLGEVDELSTFSQVASLLALPDDQFAVLKEQFLFEIEKELNDPNQELFLVQSLNSTGTKAEDLIGQYDALLKEIDNELVTVLNADKRAFLKRLIFLVINAISRTEGVAKRIIVVPTELSNGADLPTYAHLTDAGADIIALEDIDLAPGEQKLIPTGLKVAIPLGYALLIQPRSGLSSKSKIRIANTPGLIDSGYRGEIKVILENIEPPIKDISYDFDNNGRPVITSILHGASAHISKGQRFAQMRLVEVPRASYYQVDSINEVDSDRGAGGFGSTDFRTADAIEKFVSEEQPTVDSKIVEVSTDAFIPNNEQNNN